MADLPNEILDKIGKELSYKDLAKLAQTNKRFKEISKRVLDRRDRKFNTYDILEGISEEIRDVKHFMRRATNQDERRMHERDLAELKSAYNDIVRHKHKGEGASNGNQWINHVKKVASEKNISYKDALSVAKKTYKK